MAESRDPEAGRNHVPNVRPRSADYPTHRHARCNHNSITIVVTEQNALETLMNCHAARQQQQQQQQLHGAEV